MKLQRKQKRTDLDTLKITSQDIFDEWQKSPNEPTETMGEYFISIAQTVIQSPYFRGYAQDIKDELKSDAVFKMLKNYKNLREDRKSTFYGYLYQCGVSACLTYLKKYYNRLNLQKKLYEDMKLDFVLNGGKIDE